VNEPKKAPEYLTEIRIRLNEPIVCVAAGATRIDEVVLRRPKARHLRELEALSGHQTAAYLIGALSTPALSPSEIDELDGNDFKRLDEACARFFRNSRSTGGSASSTSP